MVHVWTEGEELDVLPRTVERQEIKLSMHPSNWFKLGLSGHFFNRNTFIQTKFRAALSLNVSLEVLNHTVKEELC